MFTKFVMTLLCAFTFCGGFQHCYFKFRFGADKKLLEASCVRNFRNPLFAKLLLFEILEHFKKLFWAKILGVRNFRVFEILGHLPYLILWKKVKIFDLRHAKWALGYRIWSRKGNIRYILSAEIILTNFLLPGKTEWGGRLYRYSQNLGLTNKHNKVTRNECHKPILLIIFIIYYWFTYIFFILIFIL